MKVILTRSSCFNYSVGLPQFHKGAELAVYTMTLYFIMCKVLAKYQSIPDNIHYIRSLIVIPVLKCSIKCVYIYNVCITEKNKSFCYFDSIVFQGCHAGFHMEHLTIHSYM